MLEYLGPLFFLSLSLARSLALIDVILQEGLFDYVLLHRAGHRNIRTDASTAGLVSASNSGLNS
jgi:hypothetical protein